jgi:DNA-binding CsgD family transcriptional regulator
MSKSNRIRLRELRQAYRLLHECRDLGHDPRTWHEHMLVGLLRLVGGAMAASGVIHAPTTAKEPPTLVHMAEVGDERWPRHCSDFARNGVLTHCISYQRFSQQLAGKLVRRGSAPRGELLLTRSNGQLMSRTEWERSLEFNDVHKPFGLDDALTTCHLVSPSVIYGLTLHRSLDDRPFGSHERRLLHLFHQELARYVGTALCWEPDPGFSHLPPRLRQTLSCLLEGDSEKQVAAHLGLSRHTVHEYVTALYRAFGVNSRPELLVLCLRRRPPGLA